LACSVLLLLLLILCPTLTAIAQETQTISVRGALRDADGDYIPDRLGETVTLVGVLTSDPLVLGSAACLVNLQDDTGGIVLFTPDTTLLVGQFNRGDLVKVRGKIGQYKGLEQLVIAEIQRLGTGTVPAPREVLAADLLSERYEGQLVRVEGRLIIPPDFAHNEYGLFLHDRSGEITILVPPRLFNNPKFSERLMKGGNVEIDGTLGQYKDKPPYNSGYRVVPRDLNDFRFAPLPPYRTIVVSVVLSVLFGVMLYLWLRRRTAERRAREMALLSQNLKRSEEALRERTTYLNALIENNPLAILVYDPQGRVQMCNPAFERLFLCRQEEIVGAKLDELIKTGELPSGPEEITRRVLAGETVHVSTRRRRRDGTDVDVDLYGVPLIVRGTTIGAYSLYEDVSDRKALEEQLLQTQKMEAVGRLAGGVAHDFNNLLMVIRGHADLLLESPGPPDSQDRRVKQIQMAAERAASLTQQLLAYSRKHVIAPKVLDLNSIVTEMGKMLPPMIREDIELATVPSAKLGRVKADPGQIEQVLMNLAANARDAMPRGGKLTIETADVELDEVYARHHAGVRPGAYVMLAVSDTGCGMDAETRSHIFEPFFTTKEKGKGTGLGLASVYGTVKQSGGHIWVYSEPGHGTTFKVYLPRIEDALEKVAKSERLPVSLRGAGTILLVEDEEAVRDLVRESLQQNGYTVLEAKDGTEALQISKRYKGPIHLLLTDVIMPGMNGRELAQGLASSHPDMKVLYMSGYTENAVVHDGVLDSGMALLQKPFTRDQLAKRVREVLDGDRRSTTKCK
jgi:PAS domain S-box-containing protein